MINKSLIVALCLSLLFNLFVLVGFVRARALHGPQRDPDRIRQRDGQPPHNRMARDLKLNDRQAAMLASLQEDQRQRGQVFENSIVLVRQSLNEELRKEEPDIERVRELVNEEADLFRQRRLSEANLLGKFMDELSPEQKRMWMERMGRDRKPQPPIPPRILEKFDYNKNGKLDHDEMREARREMERRRREMADRPLPPPAVPPQHDPS